MEVPVSGGGGSGGGGGISLVPDEVTPDEDDEEEIPVLPITVALTASSQEAAYGSEITLTAVVSSNAEESAELSGTVKFYKGEDLLDDAQTLTENSASVTVTTLAIGANELYAVYTDANDNETRSGIVTVTITNPVALITLKTNAASASVKDKITFTATAENIADGEIAFSYYAEGVTEKILGTVALTDGTATLTTTEFPKGKWTVKAEFPGNDDYGSAFATVTQTVLSDNNRLKSLKVNSSNISLSGSALEYSLNLSSNSTYARITAVTEDNGATLRIDGRSTVSGRESDRIYLAEGQRITVQVVVTAENETTRTYQVRLYRKKSSSGSSSASMRYRYAAAAAANKIVYGDIAYSWAAEYINALTEGGIFTGEQVGGASYFYPDRSMTRTEFAVVIARMMDADLDLTRYLDLPFADANAIPEWGGEEVRAVYYHHWMDGDGANFNPNQSITRAEAMTVIARIAGYQGDGAVFDDDGEIPAWARGAIAGLIDAGVVNGYPDNTIKPNATITRAEIAGIVYKIAN
ncbi:MAG: S-layer homology domain-containing protein [Clostridiales bacterium]|nr:S-layer homology domain-containing protein [Clostridiales bacterium]